jgi:hypothetical protein
MRIAVVQVACGDDEPMAARVERVCALWCSTVGTAGGLRPPNSSEHGCRGQAQFS